MEDWQNRLFWWWKGRQACGKGGNTVRHREERRGRGKSWLDCSPLLYSHSQSQSSLIENTMTWLLDRQPFGEKEKLVNGRRKHETISKAASLSKGQAWNGEKGRRNRNRLSLMAKRRRHENHVLPAVWRKRTLRKWSLKAEEEEKTKENNAAIS